MILLKLFDTCGPIVAVVMFLAGIAAVVLCVRASRQPNVLPLRRAVYGSLLPLAVGIAGALFGLVYVLSENPPGGLQNEHWANLGKVVLAGLTVSAMPMLWCLMMLRPRVA